MEALVVCGIYAFALLKGAEAKHCVPLFLCMSSRHFVRSSVYFTTAHVVCDSQEPGSHRPFSPVDGAMQGQGCFQRGLQNGPSGRATCVILGAQWIRIESAI